MEFSVRRRKMGDVPTSILDLPFCIMLEIFSRFPITTICACKSVCNVWYAYISSPEFGNIYLKKTPCVSVILFSLDFAYRLLELKADYDYTSKRNRPRILRNQLLLPNGLETLLGSCNGLLCFLHCTWDYGYTLSIWNPLTGERGLLPPPSVEESVKAEAFLFGFSEKTEEFKVLRIFTKKWKCGKTEAQVCTIGGDDGWRILNQDVPLPQGRKWLHQILDDPRICEVTFNGALHWITGDSFRSDFLFSFDISEEKIRPVPQPRGVIRNGYTALGVLRDCLCVFQITKPPELDIWSMKEYGVMESWTKETIMCSCLPVDLPKLCYPIVSWRGAEMLLCTDYGTLISYNPEEKRSTKVIINADRPVRGYAVPYAPCFLSCKDLIKGFGGQLKFADRGEENKQICFKN